MINHGHRTWDAPRWRRVALVLLAVKLVYLAGVSVAVWRWPNFEADRATRIQKTWFPEGWPPEARGEFERHFATWDAEHYLYLSATGYAPGARSIAFYPLWPLAIRAGAALTGLMPEAVGLVLANLFSLAGWLLFHRVAARRFGERTADVARVLLVAFPGALFFQFIYSESLFFLLIMILWWWLERGRYGPAGVAAFLAPLARGVGAFAMLPLAWHALSVAKVARTDTGAGTSGHCRPCALRRRGGGGCRETPECSQGCLHHRPGWGTRPTTAGALGTVGVGGNAGVGVGCLSGPDVGLDGAAIRGPRGAAVLARTLDRESVGYSEVRHRFF